jgi:hypothetical protein
MKMLRSIPILLFLAIALQAESQVPVTPIHPPYGPNDTIVVYATVMPDGTLVPTAVLPMVECVGKMPRWMAKQNKKMTRLRNAVYVTYPYAREASRIINYINRRTMGMPEKNRKDFIKQQEQELKDAFGDRVTSLSVYQGKVLMKLINRQTGVNVYDILKEYKGGLNARFWQTVAFVFGSSLKQPYDPRGDDAEMEGYVLEVAHMYGDTR